MPPRRLQICRLIYGTTVGALFAFAIWRRFSLPLDPLSDADTWGYLGPALSKLTGGSFDSEGRHFVYPGFLFLLLRFFGDFRAITVVQHLLGLAAGGLLLLTWRRAHRFVAAPFFKGWSPDVAGLMAVAVFLFAGDPIRMEMQIRPEGVCAFMLSLNLWLAVQFSARTFIEAKWPSVGLGVGLAMTALLLASLKPAFVFLSGVSVLPLGLAFLRPGFLSQKIRLAAGAIACALLLFTPEYFFNRDHYAARMFLPTTLFTIHADMIRDQMADDLAHGAKLPYARDWLARVHAELSEEIVKSRAATPQFPTLGFSPDYLMYPGESIAVRLAFEFGEDPRPLAAFYRFYYWRTWRQRPLAMLNKVGRQMALFYAPVCPAYERSKFMLLTEAYRLSVSSLNHHTYPTVWKRYPPAAEFMSRAEQLAQTAPPIEQRRVLRRALTFLARAYLPLLVSTLFVAAAVCWRRAARQRLGWLVALTLFVFSYNAAACLEVAILHSLEVSRYSWIQMFVTLVAEFLALWLLLEFLFQRRLPAAAPV